MTQRKLPPFPWRAVLPQVVLIVILLGPRAHLEERWIEPEIGGDVSAYLGSVEAGVPNLRAEARKEVIWADPEARSRTPLALVYLHGFSADRHEVDPLVQALADSLHANVYFTRLTGHGRDGAAMAEASAEDWLDDAAEAIAVGRAVGERVVLLGTSTGATLATWVASRPEARDALAAVVLMSPNFGPRDKNSEFLLWPWGGFIARRVIGPERCFTPANEQQASHWTTCYPTEALLPMMALTERAWTLDKDAITTPLLTLYSEDDQVVDARRTVAAFGRFHSVPKRLLPVEASPGAAYHVLAGEILSPATTVAVERDILEFLAGVL